MADQIRTEARAPTDTKEPRDLHRHHPSRHAGREGRTAQALAAGLRAVDETRCD
jgi:hypothetical protein